MTTMTATAWSDLGACRGLDPELFHPDRGESTHDARAVCAACPVRVPCLDWALATRQVHGLWGGTSERERRRIRRRLAAGELVPELEPGWVPVDRTGQPLTITPPPPPTSNEPEEDPVMELVTATTRPPPVGNGRKPVVNLDDDAPAARTDACVNCGKRYTPKRKDQRFHSKECARAWYAAHPRSESGQREPRIRTPRSPAPPATSVGTALPDIHDLLGQLLGACDRWAIEADLGDIRISVTKACAR